MLDAIKDTAELKLNKVLQDSEVQLRIREAIANLGQRGHRISDPQMRVILED
jgi:hypothetical protein